MSTRWYPIYQRGNPQRRIFLPNFWMKIIKPTHPQPENVVSFKVSIEMTVHDVRNYLEKIYNVSVADVRTRIAMGRTKRDPVQGYIVKEDDDKIAYVVLPKGQTFTFPNIFETKVEERYESEKKALEEMKNNYKEYIRKQNKPGIPGWFS